MLTLIRETKFNPSVDRILCELFLRMSYQRREKGSEIERYKEIEAKRDTHRKIESETDRQ